jgi:hypothetical protein
MLNDHMDTASAAVLQQIDNAFVPFFSYMTARVVANRTDALGTFKAIKTAMRRNLVPSNEPITFVMDTEEEAAILGSSVYTTPAVTGQASNTMIQSGTMSPLLGIQPIGVSDAVATISPGTISMQTARVSGTVGAVGALGATVVTMSGLTAGLTVKQGDVFSIAGIPFKFVAVGAPVTTAASTTISIYPPLPVSVPVGAIVVFEQLPVAIRFDPYYATIAFTPKAFGVIPCELPEEGTDLGVKQVSMTDADTNLTIRATMEYNSNQAGYGAKQVKLDGLYAIGPLDSARGVLVCRKDRIEPY